MEPAWVAAIAAGISSVVASVSAGAAVWSARNGKRTLARADADSRARTRPMVAAELRDEPYAPATQLLVIKNYGPTIARNVTVTFDPPLGDPPPEQEHESVAPFLKRRYAKPIPALVPGMELDNIYYDGTTDGRDNRNPFPDQVTVTIELDAPDGERYVDRFELDVSVIRNRTFVTSSTHPEQRMKQAVTALKRINESLSRIARALPADRYAGAPQEWRAELERRLLGKPTEGPPAVDEDHDGATKS
ncbi:hypothetical protein L1857_26070 [Amycolatopsis thermalba]|uniref:Secreted protein n=1 Tax=Amycolatopsis thermalba TaxID=944492 RepID=A0ABY4P0Z3_9PSEU|nr:MULTISPECIES: hypothetical protein [Amycolatopsis]UQS26030.1 hypothetical protein L1857_26070 [Amycolatopsis thermalba]